ncbi:MAG: hypothetical protein NTAFB01_30900 [Nitrospira sp.]
MKQKQHKPDVQVGHTIKILRTALGIKQKDFANRLDIQPHYLSLIESGKREPSLQLLRSIARKLNVPVGLLFWEGEERSRIHTGTEQEELLKHIRSLLLQMETARLKEKKAS